MKYHRLIITSIAIAMSGLVQAQQALDEAELGLSKFSVFDVPTPEAFSHVALDPEDSDALPRAYPGAPPQVPHEVESMLPIVANDNQCLDCHDKPKHIGKKSSTRSPMPESHYAKKGEDKKEWRMAGARFTCTQCHVPQAEVGNLVDNTFEVTE